MEPDDLPVVDELWSCWVALGAVHRGACAREMSQRTQDWRPASATLLPRS